MAISPETIERVRNAVDIVEVIDSYVPLKRSGAGYKALSPFNKEKTPSFNVNPEKQIFKCFSSGLGGDVFKFLMLYENLEFPEAVRRLAERAGIEILEERGGEDQARREKKSRLLTLHDELMARWREFLLHRPEAEGARQYMKSREIPLAWVEEYDLGYAPDSWDDALKWGRSKGYSEDELLEAGVLVKNEQGRVYDRFRDRLVFAIHNDTGQIIGFSARALDPEAKGAKYINSPETPIFNKGRILFGFHRAKRPILDADTVVLCEGQIDVLRCHATGMGNVVAPLGTAFTPEHARLMGRHANRVVLCLDADAAGQKAASRAAETLIDQTDSAGTLMQADLGIRVVQLPAGHDPDSLIREQGVEAMNKLLAESVEYIDFFVDRMGSDETASDLSAKRKQAMEVAQFILQVPNAVLREQLIQRAALRMDISRSSLEEELKRLRRPRKVSEREGPGSGESPPKESQLEWHPRIREILLMLLARPTLIPDLQKSLDVGRVQVWSGAEFLRKIIDGYNNDAWSDRRQLEDGLSEAEREAIGSWNFESLEELETDRLREALENACQRIRQQLLVEQLQRVNQALRQEGLDKTAQRELLAKQAELLKLKNTLTTQT